MLGATVHLDPSKRVLDKRMRVVIVVEKTFLAWCQW
jgi:hypothetical protein